MRTPRFERIAREMLDESGVPYSVQVGSKHMKILIADRLITVFSRGDCADIPRKMRNFEKAVQRGIREYKERKSHGQQDQADCG